MSSSAGPAAVAPSGSGLADVRLTSRLAIAYLLDMASIARGERHLLDTLLMATISQANVAQISRQADLQVAYAAPDAPPPDELRRPVTINALATSLRLPFETVRRHVRGLIREELCRAVEGGVIVHTAVVSTPLYLRQALAGYARLIEFYVQMRDLGLLGELPPPSVELGADIVPIRTVARVSTDYLLRVVDTLTRSMGDLLDGLILFEVVRSNTEHLPADLRGGDGAAPEDFIADDLRRPVRITAIAARMGLPIETVRRHAGALIERGYCLRTPAGLLVPAAVLARPAVLNGMGENIANLQRMFAALSQLGVLTVWDRARPPATDAAQPQSSPIASSTASTSSSLVKGFSTK